MKTNVLFVCAANSCRSQMAEGFLRHYSVPGLIVASAGVTKSFVHPSAIAVMAELGVNISNQRSKSLGELGTHTFALVVTLCAEALHHCAPADESLDLREGDSLAPIFSGAPAQLHWPITDPAACEGGEGEGLGAFRLARDAIKRRVEVLLKQGYLASLAAQNAMLERIGDAQHLGWLAHDQHRRIYLFNKAAEELTGLSREEVLGRTCKDVFGPDGLCGAHCRTNDDLPTGESSEFEIHHRLKGATTSLRMHHAPLERECGKPWLLISFEDNTEVAALRSRLATCNDRHGIVGDSPSIHRVWRTLRAVSQSDYPVVIEGESGTGKELFAKAIHTESSRSSGPFVTINCGAVPASILESEFFGHVKGAFTGAIREKRGQFELADKGTLFLDEIGELSLPSQVTLLRALQEGTFVRVGGVETLSVDVRVVAATSKNLAEMVKTGEFRDDLYYRLAVVPLYLPPLRERVGDVPLLALSILEDLIRTRETRLTLSAKALHFLQTYHWPGNVRELINVLKFATVLCADGEIQPAHLPAHITQQEAPNQVPKMEPKLDLQTVHNALVEKSYNKVKAAKALGVGRATLYRFLNKHPEIAKPPEPAHRH